MTGSQEGNMSKNSIWQPLIFRCREYGFKSIFRASLYLFLKRTFDFWEKMGFYVIPAHFYEPIPNSRDLALNERRVWKISQLIGLDMNDKLQLTFLGSVFPKYYNEYVTLSKGLIKDAFQEVDREVLYCMTRHFKPPRIIEIGSGTSTHIFIKAILTNRKDEESSELIVVDPYPTKTVKKLADKHKFRLVQDKCENLEVDFFSQLKSGDILFTDSTHVVKTGGEVNYLFLDILPRLNKGVIVHVHDVFLPLEYPKDWLLKKHVFWTEQYLLHAFLIYNDSFEVLWGGSYMNLKYPQKLRSAFPSYNPYSIPASFWFRRVR